MTLRVGVLLAGCGVFDGSEIHEAVLTLLALDRAGVEAICMAPNKQQYHVLNHLNMEELNEDRNVLMESARIARGNIVDIATLGAKDIDAMIIPGGFGAVKNISRFALEGPSADMDSQVARMLNELRVAGKPIGAACIAPALIVSALAKYSPEITIGDDTGTASALESMGGQHHTCKVNQVHVDRVNKLVTTPAYMLGQGLKDVAQGIDLMVENVLALIETK